MEKVIESAKKRLNAASVIVCVGSVLNGIAVGIGVHYLICLMSGDWKNGPAMITGVVVGCFAIWAGITIGRLLIDLATIFIERK